MRRLNTNFSQSDPLTGQFLDNFLNLVQNLLLTFLTFNISLLTFLSPLLLPHGPITAYTTPEVFINEFLPNPAGSDAGKEWVELYNPSDVDIDLTGWKIQTVSSSGAIRSTVLPVSSIKTQEYFMVIEADALFAGTNKVNVGSGKLNMYNDGVKIQLLDNNDVLIDELDYSTSADGKSWERPGPDLDNLDCKILVQNLDGSTIGSDNSNRNPICWNEEIINEITIDEIIFSADQINWDLSHTDFGETKLFFNYTLSDPDAVVTDIQWFLADETEIQNPNTFTNYLDKPIKLKLTLDSGEILEAESEPINIHGDTIQISEVYPSPNTTLNEKEWIEIYNFGSEPIDLTNWYFRDRGSGGNEYGGTQSKLLSVILNPGEYLVIEDIDLDISLNNSGDVITLFAPNDEVIDSLKYDSTLVGISNSRIFENGKYIINYSDVSADNFVPFSNIVTKGSQNQFPVEVPIEFTDIATAKLSENGDQVAIKGYVISQVNILGDTIFYLQDDTGGIKIDLTSDINLELGDGQIVRIIGVISESSDERKINVDKIEDLITKDSSGTNFGLREIEVVNNFMTDLERFEGMLVQLEGKIVNNYSTSFDLETSEGVIRVSVLSSTGIEIGEKAKGDYAYVTGVLSQNGETYRVLPRYQSDLRIVRQIVAPSSSTKATKTTSTAKKSSASKVTSKPKVLASSDSMNLKTPSLNYFFTDDKSQQVENRIYLWPVFLAIIISCVFYFGKKRKAFGKFKQNLVEFNNILNSQEEYLGRRKK